MQKMEEDFIASAKHLGRAEETARGLLNGWKNLQVMVLTAAMPLPIQL